jgi:hypothetical protein
MAKSIRWVLRHPILVLAALGAVTAALCAFIPTLHVDVDFTNYLNRNDPAVIAADEAKDRYGSQLTLMVIVEAETTVFTPDSLRMLETLGDELEALSVVDKMDGPLNAQAIRGSETSLRIGAIAPGGRAPTDEAAIAAYAEDILGDARLTGFVVSGDGRAAAFYLRPPVGTEMIPFAEAVEKVVDRTKAANPGVTFSIAGTPYINLTLGRSMGRDLRVFLPLVILAIVGVLAFSFRWLWGVLIPFFVVAASNLWMVGLMAIAGVPITVISFILPVVVMAIGIADGIHVISRYREELADGRPKDEAILATMATMARPVVLTSLTTTAGFLSLLNAYLVPQRMFGLFAGVGILVAMILSLVLIPAVLCLVAPPRPVCARRSAGEGPLGRLALCVSRHRRAVVVGSILIAGAFTAGLPMIRIETSQRAYLGVGHPAVLSLDVMAEHFAGADQVAIEIDTGRRDGLKDPEILEKMAALQAFLEARGVRVVTSLVDIIREMNQRFHADDPAFHRVPGDPRMVAQLLLLFTFQGGNLGSMALGDFSAGVLTGYATFESGAERVALVNDVTAYLDEHFATFETARMVGTTQIQASMFASIARSQVSSLFTSIGAAGGIVILLMRSFLAGIVSLVPLVLTVLVSFGVMAYSGTPLDIATLMVSSITIGIGVDYGIHFIERFREAEGRGLRCERALYVAGTTAGRAIVYNALSLALGFAVLILSSFLGMRNFGLLVMMTMIVSAIGALLVIPAILGAVHPWSRRRRSADSQNVTMH